MDDGSIGFWWQTDEIQQNSGYISTSGTLSLLSNAADTKVLKDST